MSISFRIISIGALAAHPLWNEKGQVRTPHTTTTLIEAGRAKIIVNPGLPAPALLARLGERTSVRAQEITHVFLTSLMTDHLRAIQAFERAAWMCFEREAHARMNEFQHRRDEMDELGDDEVAAQIDAEQNLLSRFEPAPDRIADGVDLFPLPGVTPGCCGLLLPMPGRTVLITGDAVATSEHLEAGQILPQCSDHEQAMESFREAIEIADVIIPGRDNVIANPLRQVK